MKTLILMRHAKSAWDDPNQADFDRPVSARGKAAAPRMGVKLAAEGFVPELVLCSGAQRARETLELIKPSLPKRTRIQYLREFYMATPRELLNGLGKVKTEASVLVIGHNPGIGNLAAWLVGQGKTEDDAKAIARMRAKFPTAAVAVLNFDIPRWSDVTGESGELVAFLRPRDLD